VERGDAVLQRGQVGDGLGRDQVVPRREDLVEPGERRAALLARLAQAAGAQLRRVVVSAGLVEAVLAEHARDPRPCAEQTLVGGGSHASSRWVWTITTVQGALCETRFGTLRSRNSRRPLMPTLPTTSTSAFSRRAASTIASDGSSPETTAARLRSPGSVSMYSSRSVWASVRATSWPISTRRTSSSAS